MTHAFPTRRSSDLAAIAAHINQEALAPLDPAIAMAMLAEDDPAYGLVRDRAKAEEADIGLAALRVLCRAGAAIFAENVDNPGDAPIRSGRLPEFEMGPEERVTAVAMEAEEREKPARPSFIRIG